MVGDAERELGKRLDRVERERWRKPTAETLAALLDGEWSYDRHMNDEPRTFFMHLPQAVLAFEPDADEYLVYSLPPAEEALPKGEWDAIRPA